MSINLLTLLGYFKHVKKLIAPEKIESDKKLILQNEYTKNC